jgi:hypothetical protein
MECEQLSKIHFKWTVETDGDPYELAKALAEYVTVHESPLMTDYGDNEYREIDGYMGPYIRSSNIVMERVEE